MGRLLIIQIAGRNCCLLVLSANKPRSPDAAIFGYDDYVRSFVREFMGMKLKVPRQLS